VPHSGRADTERAPAYAASDWNPAPRRECWCPVCGRSSGKSSAKRQQSVGIWLREHRSRSLPHHMLRQAGAHMDNNALGISSLCLKESAVSPGRWPIQTEH
jgi:hypothetical protein